MTSVKSVNYVTEVRPLIPQQCANITQQWFRMAEKQKRIRRIPVRAIRSGRKDRDVPAVTSTKQAHRWLCLLLSLRINFQFRRKSACEKASLRFPLSKAFCTHWNVFQNFTMVSRFESVFYDFNPLWAIVQITALYRGDHSWVSGVQFWEWFFIWALFQEDSQGDSSAEGSKRLMHRLDNPTHFLHTPSGRRAHTDLESIVLIALIT